MLFGIWNLNSISAHNYTKITLKPDHPSNSKRGGVCIYHKNSIPLRVLDIYYLQDCINFEIRFGDKLCNFISLNRSSNQSNETFNTFANDLELNLDLVLAKDPL